MRTRFFAFASLVALAAVSGAAANDSMAELKTGGLEFVQTDDVSMAEETLYISPEKVRVQYRFHNNSDKDVEALVAFPMPDITSGFDEPISYDPDAGDNFLGFEVKQDGKPIETKLQQQVFVNGVDLTAELTALGVPLMPQSTASDAALAKLPPEAVSRLQGLGLVRLESWDAGKGMETHITPSWTLKTVYWWKTVYPAGRDVEVTHSYNTSVGGTVDLTYLDENGKPAGDIYEEYLKRYCIDDGMVRIAQKNWKNEQDGKGPIYVENWISYILMTGNNWAGPIGTFKLVVDKGDTKNVVSFCGEGVKKTGPTTFEMDKTDFYPERDLEILLLKPAGE